MTTPVLLANSELVAVAWIQSIPGFTADVVATSLPPDDSQWAANGAVQISVVGGAPAAYYAYHRAVVQADCFASRPGSNKPPWGKALALASQIYVGCLDRRGSQRMVTLIANGVAYPSATVRTAYAMTEPRRLPGDPADYASYTVDIALTWSQDGQVTP